MFSLLASDVGWIFGNNLANEKQMYRLCTWNGYTLYQADAFQELKSRNTKTQSGHSSHLGSDVGH